MSQNQFSLRKCAELDAIKHGPNAHAEWKKKNEKRRYRPKHMGRRTNVGDPTRKQK